MALMGAEARLGEGDVSRPWLPTPPGHDSSSQSLLTRREKIGVKMFKCLSIDDTYFRHNNSVSIRKKLYRLYKQYGTIFTTPHMFICEFLKI